MLSNVEHWEKCKNLLVIRPDNMGDLLMCVPALRALKQTFNCRITLLTSTMAELIVPYLPEIDNTIIFDLPWVKVNEVNNVEDIQGLIITLKQHSFDAAIIFTVCSQNPMPSIMLAYLAGIPLRLAYCRENPYNLLTHWAPDKEPYTFIQHQVSRDLALVATIGAYTSDDLLSFTLPKNSWTNAAKKMEESGVDLTKPWLILHAPVSEKKREFDPEKWVAAARLIRNEMDCQIVLTGTIRELELVTRLHKDIGKNAFVLAGVFKLNEFMAAIQNAPLVLSVNTATIHIAAAAGTPVVVLYARTNPQHTPWKVPCEVLYFSAPEEFKSKNEVVQFLQNAFEETDLKEPTPEDILVAAKRLVKR